MSTGKSSLKADEALFHVRAKVGQRSKGQNAVAAAAYRAGARLMERKEQQEKDYGRKSGVVDARIIPPENAPDWAHDREEVWNREEAANNRKNHTIYREVEASIPRELPRDQWWPFLIEITEPYRAVGAITDIAIHDVPSADGGRNIHTHILLTTRKLDPETEVGFATKKNDDLTRLFESGGRLGGKKGEALKQERARWAGVMNKYLRAAGSNLRVDYRSYEDRQDGRLPEPTYGEQAAKIFRQTGKPSELQRMVGNMRAQKRARHVLDKLDQQEFEMTTNPFNPDGAGEPGDKAQRFKWNLLLKDVRDLSDEAKAELMNEIQQVSGSSRHEGKTIIRMKDGSYVEYVHADAEKAAALSYLGGPGEHSLAKKMAEAIRDAAELDGEPVYLRRNQSVADKERPTTEYDGQEMPVPAERMREEQIRELQEFWLKWGFYKKQMHLTPDGLMIKTGRDSMIIDRGDRLDFYGKAGDREINALIHKAQTQWGGAMKVWGSQSFKDKAWLAAKRAGVEVVNYEPSPHVMQKWMKEVERKKNPFSSPFAKSGGGAPDRIPEPPKPSKIEASKFPPKGAFRSPFSPRP